MNICPVCGYPELSEPPYDGSVPSYEVCPSCFFEFGYDDEAQGFTYEEWRKEWIAEGMQWRGSAAKPVNWNPEIQLKNTI